MPCLTSGQVVTFNTAMEDKSNLTIKYGLEEPTRLLVTFTWKL